MKKFGFVLVAASAIAMVAFACPAGAAENDLSETSFVFESKAPKGEVKTVVFKAEGMHCGKCAEKVNGNIAFEKGVVDLKTDVKTRTVTIKYDASKTSVEKLAAALKKLGYPSEVVKN